MLFGDWFMWKKQKRGDLPWKWSFWRVSKLVLYAQSTGMVISGWFLEGCRWVFEDFFKESSFFPSGLLNTQPRTDVDLWTVLLWERNQANIAVYSMLLYILYVITPHVVLLKVCIVFWKSVPPWLIVMVDWVLKTSYLSIPLSICWKWRFKEMSWLHWIAFWCVCVCMCDCLWMCVCVCVCECVWCVQLQLVACLQRRPVQ